MNDEIEQKRNTPGMKLPDADQETHEPGDDRDDELSVLRKTMFDLLRRHGYDRAEVEYEGERGVYWVLDMTFYKGDVAVPEDDAPREVIVAVWGYVSGRIPMEEVYTESCDGSARIYTPSEYACFRQYASTADYFWDGDEPGDEVLYEDICPAPEDEELLNGSSYGFEGDDECDEDDEFEDDECEDEEADATPGG